MSLLVRMERALMSVIQPLTGARATGNALVRATGADVELPRNSYAGPLILSDANRESFDHNRLVKTASAVTVTVTAAGTTVPIFSMLGGTQMNLDPMRIRWDPPVDGVELVSTISSPGLAGGTDSTEEDAVAQVTVIEGLGTKDVARKIWASGAMAGRLPLVILSWESAQAVRKQGLGKTWERTTYRAYIIVDRLDGDHERRDQGKTVLQGLKEWWFDRAEVDGEVFSVPPIDGGPSGRLQMSAEHYVYFVEFVVVHTTKRREPRTFNDWKKTRERIRTTPDPQHPPGTELDQEQEMP
jgi:hypothetical protein